MCQKQALIELLAYKKKCGPMSEMELWEHYLNFSNTSHNCSVANKLLEK